MSNEENKVVVTMRSVILEAVDNNGTIEDNRELIKSLASSVSNHLLMVAHSIPPCNEEGKDKSALFIAACEIEEAYIKSDDAGIHKVDKLPRCYINPKSVIKSAYDLGINLKDYQTESELRKKVAELRKAKKESEEDKEDSDTINLMDEDVIEIDPRLSQSVAAFLNTIKDLKGHGDKVDSIIEVINQANTRAKEVLNILVPVEPKKPASKKVVSKKKAVV